MSKQETIVDVFTNSAPVWPEHFSSIAGVFQAWAQAFDLSRDNTEKVSRDAKETMERLWDTARMFPSRSAADVAAIYIMGQNTRTVEPDAFLEDAWRIVTAASGEAELAQLYATWIKLRAAVVDLDLDDDAGDGIYAIAADLEAKMAAIPATTAKGLAIKVDVFGQNVKAHAGRISLDRDLATLTGQDVRPE